MKERIIAAAMDSFMRYGIKAVSIENIASTLRVSKRTIYENFENKSDLLAKSLRWSLTKKQDEIASIQDGTTSPTEAIIYIYMKSLMQIHDMCPALYMDIDNTPELKEIKDEHVSFINKQWLSLINDAINKGYMLDHIKVEAIVEMFQSQALWFRHNSRDDINKKSNSCFQIFTIFLCGASTQKGREEVQRVSENFKLNRI